MNCEFYNADMLIPLKQDGGFKNSKFEYRNSKQFQMFKYSKSKTFWSFGFWILDLFRISDFPPTADPP